jgi:protein-S-isoprenylcysteine O-methyltransferase Ste14
MTGLLVPLAVYGIILLLHLALPARRVEGYVTDQRTGQPLSYRLNGLLVLCGVLGLWWLAERLGPVAWDFLWVHRIEAAVGACALGLVFTAGVVLTAPPTGKGLWADLYLGRLANPQALSGRLDAKMYLYLAGAIMLELNVLSFAAHQGQANGGGAASPGVVLYAALFSFFVAEYLWFEQVHLYTYDFVAERVGFKLGWGCLAFYPFFYPVGLWSAARFPDPGTPRWLLVLAAGVFGGGWVLSRGANLQKFAFKTRPDRRFLGILEPKAIVSGQHRLLCGGFWGFARHINYLGELGMAVGLTLALGRPLDPWPWLYPLYYVALLVPRQADDDRRCRAKYGPLWEEYCRRVPWRIVPGVY